jgi:hypothetical protein
MLIARPTSDADGWLRAKISRAERRAHRMNGIKKLICFTPRPGLATMGLMELVASYNSGLLLRII